MPLAQKVTGTGTIAVPDTGILTVQGTGVGGGLILPNPLPVSVPSPLPITWLPTDLDTISVLASAVRNVSITSSGFYSNGYTGLRIRLSVTVVPGVSTLLLSLVDAFNFQIHTAFATVVANGVNYYYFHPGITIADYITAANARNLAVPGRWKIAITQTGVGNFTYQVDAAPIP
jgi:hypothetical protein